MLDQLTQLGLADMVQAFAELEASGDGATLTHADWLGLLVDCELTHRRDKRLAACLRYARLRHHAVIGDVDYRAPRGLDRALFHKLSGCSCRTTNSLAPFSRWLCAGDLLRWLKPGFPPIGRNHLDFDGLRFWGRLRRGLHFSFGGIWRSVGGRGLRIFLYESLNELVDLS